MDSAHHRPKYWSFSISPSNEYSGLISFRTDCFDLCCPRDSQRSSIAPQFKSIHSSVLSLLSGPNSPLGPLTVHQGICLEISRRNSLMTELSQTLNRFLQEEPTSSEGSSGYNRSNQDKLSKSVDGGLEFHLQHSLHSTTWVGF